MAVAGRAAVVTNDSLVITSPTVFSGVTNVYSAPVYPGSILADLTLQDRSYVRFMGANQTGTSTWPTDTYPHFHIATNANDVTLTIKGDSLFAATYRNSKSPQGWVDQGIDPAGDGNAAPSRVRVHLGTAGGEPGSTGRAKIVLGDNVSGAGFGSNMFGRFWAEWLYVESSVATNAPGMIDILEIGKGVKADISCIENNSPYPARILFKGGELFRNNMNSHDTPLCPSTGHEIVCQGVNGNDVILRKQYAESTMTGRKGGTVRIIGNNVQLHSQGYNVTSGNVSFLPWKLATADNIVWENTGKISLLTSMWLQTRNDDLLPYGPGTGWLEIGYYSKSSAEGYAYHCCLDLYGTRQHLNGVTSKETGAWIGIVTNSASALGTLVLGAQDVSGTFNARCTANVEVEKVGSGSLKVTEASAVSFVANGGSVFFTGTLSTFTNISVAAGVLLCGKVEVLGTFALAGESATIDYGGLDLMLGTDAEIDLVSDGRELIVKNLSVGGGYVAPGTYAAADTAWLANGSVTVIADPAVVPTDATWTGSVSSDASVAGNWDGGPDFSSTRYRPVFASSAASTSSAVLDAGTYWNFIGLGFGGVSSFTVSGGDTIRLYGAVSVSDPGLGSRPRYEVSAPVLLRASQTITMPADGVEVVFSGGMDGDLSCGIELLGTKLSSNKYDYSTNGVLKLVNPRVSGPISHTRGGGTLVLKGQVGNPGDTEPLTIDYGWYRNGSNKNDGWCELGPTRLEGMTCWKPVTLTGQGMVVGATGVNDFFYAVAGTTNVFKEVVEQPRSMTLTGSDKSAVVVFGKGLKTTTTGNTLNLYNATYVFEGPVVHLGRPDRDLSGYFSKHVFECTGNLAEVQYSLSGQSEAEFHVDDAFKDTGVRLGGWQCAMRLNGTHQKWRFLYTGGRSSDGDPYGNVTGDGALEITQGFVDETAASVSNLAARISGHVSLEMTGSGWHTMKERAFESSGDVSVSNGTLVFGTGASWRNGTNVTVTGTGTLKLMSGNTFNQEFAVVHFADSGKIEVPAGVTQKFADGWDGDRRLAGGTIYTAANLPAHVSGAGAIYIKGGGTMLIFR